MIGTTTLAAFAAAVALLAACGDVQSLPLGEVSRPMSDSQPTSNEHPGPGASDPDRAITPADALDAGSEPAAPPPPPVNPPPTAADAGTPTTASDAQVDSGSDDNGRADDDDDDEDSEESAKGDRNDEEDASPGDED